MLLQLKSSLRAQAARYARQMGQWTYYGDPIGDFGTAYDYRTMVALMGLGANTTDVAIYPRTSTDSTGPTSPAKDLPPLRRLPPTVGTGFWSVTAYGEDNFLIDNPISRYCVNDRSGLHRNPDGSIDVTLSRCAGGYHHWLPSRREVPPLPPHLQARLDGAGQLPATGHPREVKTPSASRRRWAFHHTIVFYRVLSRRWPPFWSAA
ncbi:MAG: DUF1214 domain-containing protein [Faecalibacterium prausnitzii]